MPPQELPRHVTLQELFEDSADSNAYNTATRMTIFMLMTHQYIRVDDEDGINIYPAIFFYITSIAILSYSDHVLIITNDVPMVEESFTANFKTVFHRLYEQYFAEDPTYEAILRICAFTMNMCRYIHEHRKPRWYLGTTVLLLARFISGERFRRDAIFAVLDEVLRNYVRSKNYNMPLILRALARYPNNEPRETYLHADVFTLVLISDTHQEP